jgi:hypothetical protein
MFILNMAGAASNDFTAKSRPRRRNPRQGGTMSGALPSLSGLLP